MKRVLYGWLLLMIGALLAPAVLSGTSLRPPAEGYVLHCAGCHGSDGRGSSGVTPTLHGLARLALAPGGRSYLARVPGVAQAPIGDQELARLLNWIIATFSEDAFADVPLYSAAEVHRLRAMPLRDPGLARPLHPVGSANPGN